MTDIERELVECCKALRLELAEWRRKHEELRVQFQLEKTEAKTQFTHAKELLSESYARHFKLRSENDLLSAELVQKTDEICRLKEEIAVLRHNDRVLGKWSDE